MVVVSVTEFKAHCLRLMEQARVSGESIEVLKRGQPFATVVPAVKDAVYTPGQFKDTMKITGDIEVDGSALGISWDALS